MRESKTSDNDKDSKEGNAEADQNYRKSAKGFVEKTDVKKAERETKQRARNFDPGIHEDSSNSS